MDQSRRVLEEYYNDSNESYACPSWAPTVGFIGIACAVCFASKYYLVVVVHIYFTICNVIWVLGVGDLSPRSRGIYLFSNLASSILTSLSTSLFSLFSQ
jgi:hypothetical protein